MINLSEIVSRWPVVDGWSIAPEGVGFCAVGVQLKVGAGCRLGNWCVLGDGCVLGNWCVLGDGCVLGNWCVLGAGCRLGNWCVLGAGCSDPIDIGYADGYRKTVGHVDGVAHISAGCRWFTLGEALRHWGNHEEDRSMTMCLLEAAKAIAAKNGWRFE